MRAVSVPRRLTPDAASRASRVRHPRSPSTLTHISGRVRETDSRLHTRVVNALSRQATKQASAVSSPKKLAPRPDGPTVTAEQAQLEPELVVRQTSCPPHDCLAVLHTAKALKGHALPRPLFSFDASAAEEADTSQTSGAVPVVHPPPGCRFPFAYVPASADHLPSISSAHPLVSRPAHLLLTRRSALPGSLSDRGLSIASSSASRARSCPLSTSIKAAGYVTAGRLPGM